MPELHVQVYCATYRLVCTLFNWHAIPTSFYILMFLKSLYNMHSSSSDNTLSKNVAYQLASGIGSQ